MKLHYPLAQFDVQSVSSNGKLDDVRMFNLVRCRFSAAHISPSAAQSWLSEKYSQPRSREVIAVTQLPFAAGRAPARAAVIKRRAITACRHASWPLNSQISVATASITPPLKSAQVKKISSVTVIAASHRSRWPVMKGPHIVVFVGNTYGALSLRAGVRNLGKVKHGRFALLPPP